MTQSSKPDDHQVTTKTLPVTFNYNVPVQEKAQGFCQVHLDLTAENFPETRTDGGEDEAVLINFGENVGSEEALRHLEQMGLRAGTPSELADLHLSNPAPDSELEQYLPLAALGTVWMDSEGERRVVCLRFGAAGRGLALAWFAYGWGSHWWFLAFRK
jgi:hypothetical protein